jgi:hypothetical protein
MSGCRILYRISCAFMVRVENRSACGFSGHDMPHFPLAPRGGTEVVCRHNNAAVQYRAAGPNPVPDFCTTKAILTFCT